MRDRVDSVQAMRGVAATAVVIYHAAIGLRHAGYAPSLLYQAGFAYRLGAAGVDLFFVISGFVMAHSMARYSGKPLCFLAQRAARIIPLFWMASALLLALPWLAARGGSAEALLNTLTFVPVFDRGTYDPPPLAVGWTLGFEALFYGVVAACLTLRRGPVTALITLVGLALLAPLGAGVFGRWVLNPILLEFAFGVVAYLLWSRGVLDRCPPLMLAGLFAVASIPAIIGIVIEYRGLTLIAMTANGSLSLWRVGIWGVPALAWFCWLVRHGRRPSRPLLQLGDASYSLYLVHPIVIWSLMVLPPVLSPDLMLGVMVVASLVVGLFTYKFLEKPMTDRLQGSIAARPAIASGTSA